jgi:hypothetical protein
VQYDEPLAWSFCLMCRGRVTGIYIGYPTKEENCIWSIQFRKLASILPCNQPIYTAIFFFPLSDFPAFVADSHLEMIIRCNSEKYDSWRRSCRRRLPFTISYIRQSYKRFGMSTRGENVRAVFNLARQKSSIMMKNLGFLTSALLGAAHVAQGAFDIVPGATWTAVRLHPSW